jgi:DNA-binding transcriptional LysR family regulator
VRATPAAELLAERSLEVLASFGTLDDEIEAISAGRLGRLRLGSFPTASARVLPRGLAAFVEQYPAVEVQLDEGEPDELLPLLQSGDMDLALVYRYDLVPRRWPRRLVETRLLHEDLLLLLPSGHALATRPQLELAELNGETWIASREGTAGATCLVRACSAAGFTPKLAFRSNDYDVVQGLVAAGLGIALVPALAHVASAPGITPGVTAVHLAAPRLQRHVSTLHRVAALSAPVQGALRAFQQAAGRLDGHAVNVTR